MTRGASGGSEVHRGGRDHRPWLCHFREPLEEHVGGVLSKLGFGGEGALDQKNRFVHSPGLWYGGAGMEVKCPPPPGGSRNQ